MIPYQLVIMLMFAPFFIITATLLIIENKREREYRERPKKEKEKLYEKLREEGYDI